jgi:hypothetical protein
MALGLFMRPDLSATSGRAGLGLLAGAATGAVLTAAVSELPDLLLGRASLTLTLTIAIVAFFVWGLGLLSIGGLVWGFADKAEARGVGSAIAIGGLTPALACLIPAILTDLMAGAALGGASSSAGGVDLMVNGHRTFEGWLSTLTFAGEVGLAGCAVGLVIWLVAYRKTGR